MFMRTKVWAVFTGALALGGAAFPATATTWDSYSVGSIQMPDATRNCVFFELVGVSEADPAVPSNPWMAIRATQNGYSQIVAFLLWARAIGTPIGVVTTGAASGGGCSANGPMVGVSSIYAR